MLKQAVTEPQFEKFCFRRYAVFKARTKYLILFFLLWAQSQRFVLSKDSHVVEKIQ